MFYMPRGLTRSLVARNQEEQGTASTVTSDYSWSGVRSYLFQERIANYIDFMHFFFPFKTCARRKGRNFNGRGEKEKMESRKEDVTETNPLVIIA